MIRSARFAVAALAVSSCATAPPRAPALPPVAVTVPAPPPPAPVAKPVEVDPWADRTDLFKIPQLAPTTKVDLGTVDRFTLPNGLQVIVVPRTSVPAVDLALAIKVGGNSDPAGATGLAQFTASMLRKGTAKRTSEKIADAIDFVGGELDASAGDDATSVNCHVRAKDLALCLDLVADVVARPTFPADEMREIREQLDASVESSKDNPRALAGIHADNLFYGDDDPRGRPLSKRTIAKITRADLVAFHQRYYAPNNAILAISGAVDGKTIRYQLTRAFLAWKKHPVPKMVALALPPPRNMVVRLVDKPDATQSQIVLVGPGIRHAAPDYYAVGLMNYTLGGGVFSSRLMKSVRSEGGKTYGVSSRFSSGRDPGELRVATFTRNAETAATLKLVLDEIGKMRAGGPTDEELQAAKGHMIGGYGLHLETGSDVAGALVHSELDGLDPMFVAKYPERAGAVTVADAARAAAAHLDPQAMVVLGNAAEVKPLLVGAGYTVEDVVRYTDPVSPAERRALAAEKQVADARGVDAEGGQKLLEAALAAKGGAEALAKLTQITFHGKGATTLQGQTQQVVVDQWVVPGKGHREDLMYGPFKLVKVLVDGKGFIKQGKQVVEMPPNIVEQAKKGLWRQSDLILLHAWQPGAKVRALPAVTDGAERFDVLEVTAPDGEVTRLSLDPKTHLIARLAYRHDDAEAREDFADYRPVGGIPIARAVKIAVGKTMSLQLVYDSVELNQPVAPSLFDK